jgi:hypothetical protein
VLRDPASELPGWPLSLLEQLATAIAKKIETNTYRIFIFACLCGKRSKLRAAGCVWFNPILVAGAHACAECAGPFPGRP